MRVGAYLGKLGDELDPLRLAAGERRALLAEREIAQAHVLQQAQRVMDRGMRGEEIDRFVHAHRQHLADRFSLPAHRQRFGVEARACRRPRRSP